MLKGAQVIAAAVFLARAGAEKEEIINSIANTFDYNLFRISSCIDETEEYAASSVSP